MQKLILKIVIVLTYASVSDISGVSDKTNTTEHWQNWNRTLTDLDTSWFDIFNRTWYAWYIPGAQEIYSAEKVQKVLMVWLCQYIVKI